MLSPLALSTDGTLTPIMVGMGWGRHSPLILCCRFPRLRGLMLMGTSHWCRLGTYQGTSIHQIPQLSLATCQVCSTNSAVATLWNTWWTIHSWLRKCCEIIPQVSMMILIHSHVYNSPEFIIQLIRDNSESVKSHWNVWNCVVNELKWLPF